MQDKPRLQIWVDNMKREEWTPSRHQYLCSEHFTDDCFDIRWGIRYLKNTAIPTIFPSTEDDAEKKVGPIKRSPKAKPVTVDVELVGFDSPLSKRPLILSRTCNKVRSSPTNIAAEPTEGTFEPPLVSDSCRSDLSEVQTEACEMPSGDDGTSLEPRPEDPVDSTVTVLCCETSGPVSDGDADVVDLGRAFGFVPVETLSDEATEERGPDEGENISVYEHSYSRPDTDKDQLWSKILSLHAKILELDRREESTVAKIRALETEISLLKRDGAAFKEKQKVLEDYISSVLL